MRPILELRSLALRHSAAAEFYPSPARFPPRAADFRNVPANSPPSGAKNCTPPAGCSSSPADCGTTPARNGNAPAGFPPAAADSHSTPAKNGASPARNATVPASFGASPAKNYPAPAGFCAVPADLEATPAKPFSDFTLFFGPIPHSATIHINPTQPCRSELTPSRQAAKPQRKVLFSCANVWPQKNAKSTKTNFSLSVFFAFSCGNLLWLRLCVENPPINYQLLTINHP